MNLRRAALLLVFSLGCGAPPPAPAAEPAAPVVQPATPSVEPAAPVVQPEAPAPETAPPAPEGPARVERTPSEHRTHAPTERHEERERCPAMGCAYTPCPPGVEPPTGCAAVCGCTGMRNRDPFGPPPAAR